MELARRHYRGRRMRSALNRGEVFLVLLRALPAVIVRLVSGLDNKLLGKGVDLILDLAPQTGAALVKRW